MTKPLAIAFLWLVAMADGAGSWRPFRNPYDPELFLNAAPQGSQLFLSWNASPGATYRVRWREAGTTRWMVADAGSASTFAVSGLTDFVNYEVELQSSDGGRAITRSTPHARAGCAAIGYMSWDPRMSFFCSWLQLDLFLQREQIDPLRLRCRNQPITSWNAAAPDCLYELPNGNLALLLRHADDVFQQPVGYRDPAAVSRVTRSILWPSGDPFVTNAPLPLHDIAPIAGRVRTAARIESQRFDTAPGIASRVSWFTPLQPRANRFAIYHEGHGGAATDIGAETIDWLLARGWTVIAMDMPISGENAADIAPELAVHSDFDRRDDGGTSPLADFLLPVKAVVDAIVARSGGVDPAILMVGRSGGGWTTYTYAAIDPRIDVAVPVAGGTPQSVRLGGIVPALEVGDYEQSWPTLYTIVRHEDLMTAAGSRGSLIIYNQFDGCCFRVRPDAPFLAYLRGAAAALHQNIDVFVDERNAQHAIGPAGYERLDAYLREVFGE